MYNNLSEKYYGALILEVVLHLFLISGVNKSHRKASCGSRIWCFWSTNRNLKPTFFFLNRFVYFSLSKYIPELHQCTKG